MSAILDLLMSPAMWLAFAGGVAIHLGAHYVQEGLEHGWRRARLALTRTRVQRLRQYRGHLRRLANDPERRSHMRFTLTLRWVATVFGLFCTVLLGTFFLATVRLEGSIASISSLQSGGVALYPYVFSVSAGVYLGFASSMSRNVIRDLRLLNRSMRLSRRSARQRVIAP